LNKKQMKDEERKNLLDAMTAEQNKHNFTRNVARHRPQLQHYIKNVN